MRRLDLLLTPGFVAALLLLVLNDHLFKTLWPGLLTGKLSDVAGLYAAVVFAAAWRPRHAVAIAWITALAFIAWKSPLADPLIAWWNGLEVWPVARVVDYTDLAAIAIVPLAVRAARAAVARPPVVSAMRVVAQCALAFVAAAAFAATSRLYLVKLESPPRYLVASSCESLGLKMALTDLAPAEGQPGVYSAQVRVISYEGDSMTFWFSAEFQTKEDKCLLTLTELHGHNDPRVEDRAIQDRAVRAVEEQLSAIDPGHEKQGH